MPSHPPLRYLTMFLLLAALVALAGFGTHRVAQQLGIAELQTTGLHRLDLYTASLEREIGKYAFLPGTLGLERDVVELLRNPRAGALQPAVNNYLEQLNERAGTLSIYVIDAGGRVLASSNWRRDDSFVGEDLSFRPYFRDAMNNGNGRIFGIGTTRGEPGYYLSSRLTDDGRTLGVAVIKVSLEQLEKSWTTGEAPAMVSDENGVVILGSVADWKFTTLRPLDESTRSAFDQTQQYNRRALKPLGLRELRELDHGARLVSIRNDGPEMVTVYPVSGRFLAQSRPLPGTPWTLTVFSHLEQVDNIAHSRAAVAVVAAVLLFVFALMLAERRRHLKDRLAAQQALQQAHDELERKVDERTADLSAANYLLQDEIAERIRAERTLRAAQDELVQAGKLAVIGQLSTGIAHELNQPLAALRTLSGNGVRFLDRGDLATTRANLERIAQLVDRMGLITGQLRSFARKSGGRLQPVALDGVVDSALALLEPRLRQAGAEILRALPAAAPRALCDANRLEQVLVNLIGNALDAMAGQPAPCIELSAAAVDGKARLSVRDHGPGLPAETLAHLFEPFYTTKPGSDGLGLGLTISAGIVRDFGGTLTGSNHADGGAVFTLEIPLFDESTVND
ncbi:two-component system C4-dicarboxylate transport sensor histidine kinase DctB [Azonexus fungiphilus]|uniref:C4-dicarboxylate transport sensor protein DctB n=1 Tax=Azonexus fungiphilus TaxID=146940 RepID=A0A495VRQ3_9RHOO|nr:ATP-binding protein [Azonexus fungiphilus]RKT51143.1 two-component system C4-dicarboxylate transport sensor histidine kinase DctB [Azonexus fungiphilus]